MDGKIVVLDRTGAIVLGIAFIILVVGGIVLWATDITRLNSQISSLNSQVADLQDQVQSLNRIVNLAQFTIWNSTSLFQPGSNYTSWTFSASYAGYVSVEIYQSPFIQPTVNNAYARVIYTAYGVDYDDQMDLGKGGTAVFPILPSSNIKIIVGNNDPIISIGNLTPKYVYDLKITYYY